MGDYIYNHTVFLSPFTWRYSTNSMRQIWSQITQRKLWRLVWVALAEAQAEAGLVSAEQAAEVRAHMEDIDLERALAIEAEIHHDLMAELRTFAEQCPVGGGILHLGATSMDIEDNADALRQRQALDLVLEALDEILRVLADQIESWADVICMGFTHIQPAEPTTIGYRLAQYGQDLLMDRQEVARVRSSVRGKGLKGAVGTSASYQELLRDSTWTPADLEARFLHHLGLDAFLVATQTYPRKQDWLLINALAGIAGSLHKMMFDLRLLQSPPIGEWSEPFRTRQVGSSAMPFKRNPINAEKIDSLARWVAGLPRVAWDNAALSLLERTLDDSANRRLLLPEAFLAVDEILHVSINLIQNLHINREAVARNVSTYGTFAAIERLLMALSRAGADRQAMHERLREHSMAAWQQVANGGTNSLPDLVSSDDQILAYLGRETVLALMDAGSYMGDAPIRARQMAAEIRAALAVIS